MGIRSLTGTDNNPDKNYADVFASGTPLPEQVAPVGLTATGGVISDYISGTDIYRVHKFTGSGTFTVSSIGDFGSNVDILSVGGGGSGGSYGERLEPGNAYRSGVVGSATTTSGFPAPFTAPGGGAGGVYSGGAGGSGGSGGGGGGSSGTGGTPDAPTQGNTGGSGGNVDCGGGGGGAGANGQDGIPGPPAEHGSGGIGKRAWDDGGAPFSLGAKGPTPGAWFAGGGAGGGRPAGDFAYGGGWDGTARVPNYTSGPYAGGGTGGGGNSRPTALNIVGPESQGQDGFNNTGGGGGGGDVGNGAGHGGGGAGGYNESTAVPISTSPGEYKIYIGAGGAGINTNSGRGGSGVFLIRYPIGSLGGTAKATGGDISFYGGKTIHTFTNSQVIDFPASFSETVEYVIVAGGGGGGGSQGGGGGAGGYITGSVSVSGPIPACQVIIGAGGMGKTPSAQITDTNSNTHMRGGETRWELPSAISVTGGGGGSTYGGDNPGWGDGLDGSGGGNSGGGAPTAGGGSGSYGNPGGTSSGSAGSGGGGAGAAGGNCPGPGVGGNGGAGTEVPATFRNPIAVLSGQPTFAHYLAGGGGGGTVGGPEVAGAGGAGGGGIGGSPTAGTPGNTRGTAGYQGTGSGGGGGGPAGGDHGGSGVLLIAYPT